MVVALLSGTKHNLRILSRNMSLCIEEGMPFRLLQGCLERIPGVTCSVWRTRFFQSGGASSRVVALRHEVMPCSPAYRSGAGPLLPLAAELEGADKDAELFIPCGDVAVPELRVQEKTLFRPVGIQGLIGSVPFVREETVSFPWFDEGGVHVEGGASDGVSVIDLSDEIGVDPQAARGFVNAESLPSLHGRSRDERQQGTGRLPRGKGPSDASPSSIVARFPVVSFWEAPSVLHVQGCGRTLDRLQGCAGRRRSRRRRGLRG